MRMWPVTRWGQGWTAFVGAGVASYFVFIRSEDNLFKQAVKEAPHDGLDGLSALMGAIEIGALTLIGAFIVLFVLQRAITAIVQRNSD